MPKLHFDDTITALATPPGEGGVAIIRLSGPDSLSIIQKLFVFSGGAPARPLNPQRVNHGYLVSYSKEKLDEVLVTYFKKPHSYTGEDVVEISCHGGMRVSKALIELLIHEGARLAEPGEFTRRAFLNGKLDLVQAEAVLDVVKPKRDASLEQAEKQLRGELSKLFGELRSGLIDLKAEIEAAIDFPEDDKEVSEKPNYEKILDDSAGKIESLLKTHGKGSFLRDGLVIALTGKPNTGKSSLLNKLLQKERAIVTDIPGTTRDTIEEWVEIGGFPVKLIDTAGITKTRDPVERIGVERTKEALKEAHLVLILLDGSGSYDSKDEALFREIPNTKEKIICIAKSDLPEKIKLPKKLMQDDSLLRISSISDQGLDQLENRLLSFLDEGHIPGESLLITNARHSECLRRALQAIRKVKKGLKGNLSLEFVADDLKLALDAIGEVVGEVYTEDLLGVIFSKFCIGK